MTWISDLGKVLGGLKFLAKLKSLPEKVEALEQRIADLEAALKACPADGCPYCGERAMRLDRQEARHNGPIVAGYNEIWTCGSCGRSRIERR